MKQGGGQTGGGGNKAATNTHTHSLSLSLLLSFPSLSAFSPPFSSFVEVVRGREGWKQDGRLSHLALFSTAAGGFPRAAVLFVREGLTTTGCQYLWLCPCPSSPHIPCSGDGNDDSTNPRTLTKRDQPPRNTVTEQPPTSNGTQRNTVTERQEGVTFRDAVLGADDRGRETAAGCCRRGGVCAASATLKRECVTLEHHPITLLTPSTSLELAQFSGNQRNRTNSQTNPLRKGSDQRRPRRGSRAAEAACFGFESLRIHVIMCPLVLLGVPFIRLRRSHTAPLSSKPDQNPPVPEPQKPAECKDGIQLEREGSLNA